MLCPGVAKFFRVPFLSCPVAIFLGCGCGGSIGVDLGVVSLTKLLHHPAVPAALKRVAQSPVELGGEAAGPWQ